MKKITSIILIVILSIMWSSLCIAHSGGTDDYNGHYCQENGKWVSYHYHQGEFRGWELVLIDSMQYTNTDKRDLEFNSFKPFDITKEYTFGTWRQIDFGTENTPEITLENTPEITLENTPEVTLENTPEVTLENTPEITLENTPEITLENTPEITLENTPEVTLENTPEVTLVKSGEKQLPQTGENENITLLVVGFLLSGVGVILLVRMRNKIKN